MVQETHRPRSTALEQIPRKRIWRLSHPALQRGKRGDDTHQMLMSVEERAGKSAEVLVSAASPPGAAHRGLALRAVAAAVGLVLPVAFFPAGNSAEFLPKDVLTLVVAAVGLVPLGWLAVHSRVAWPARALIGLTLVGAISAAISSSPLVGIFGLNDWGEGELFLVALASAWAIGASLDRRGREWLVRGLLGGAAISAVVAYLQMALRGTGTLALLAAQARLGPYDGTQADGLLGNPVQLEALLLGAVALLVASEVQRGPTRHRLRSAGALLLLAGFSAGLELTGERLAPLLLVAVVVVGVAVGRTRMVSSAVALAVGYALAFAGAGRGTASRVAASSAHNTYGLRVHVWLGGIEATLLHAPLIGFGPGEMFEAIDRYQSVGLARAITPALTFVDLHDLFVNVLAMTGVIGLGCFVAFLVTTSYRVRSPLWCFAALLLVVQLVEPLSVGVTPLAFLALGAALAEHVEQRHGARRQTAGPPSSTPRSRAVAAATSGALDGPESAAWSLQRGAPRWLLGVTAVLVAVAVAAGSVAMTADVIERDALSHFSLADARTANELLPIWPTTADAIALIDAYHSVIERNTSLLAQSRNESAIAAARDPSDPAGWLMVSAADLELHQLGPAYVAIERALADEPNSFQALHQLGIFATDTHRYRLAVGAYERAVEVDPTSHAAAGWLVAADDRLLRGGR